METDYVSCSYLQLLNFLESLNEIDCKNRPSIFLRICLFSTINNMIFVAAQSSGLAATLLFLNNVTTAQLHSIYLSGKINLRNFSHKYIAFILLVADR